MVQYHPRERGGQHQHHQPRQSRPPRGEHAGAEIRLVRGQHSRHLLEVLRCLLLDNVHSVIDGDDTHQPLFQIHNGHGEEVVLAQSLRHVLLIVRGLGPHHVRVHDLFNKVVLVRQQQIPDGQHAQQMPGGIGDVQDIDGLQLAADTADPLKGVRHRHVFLQGQELHVHNGAGGVLRILEYFVDGFPHLRLRFIEDTDDHAGGHLLHDIHRVVQIQLVQHLGQLRVGKPVDEHFLTLRLQLHEHLRRRLLGQQAVQQGHLLLLPLLQEQRDVRRLHGQEQVAQLRVPLLLRQLVYPFLILLQLLLKVYQTRSLLSEKTRSRR